MYLTNGASLSGFTLTNGAGGVWCESTNATVSNCVVAGNVADGDGGGAYRGTLNDCTLVGNSALSSGGGADGSTLNNCTLMGNSVRGSWCVIVGDAAYCTGGGGASGSTLNNCTLVGNFAFVGGGTAYSMLSNCVLTGNSGGGAYRSTLNNCRVVNNSGSGASNSTLNNCTVAGNSGVGVGEGTLNNCLVVGNSGGGAAGSRGSDGDYPCLLNNCTVVGNSWGVDLAVMNNCIVYFNGAENYDYDYDTLNYCCTTPLPASGVGNLSADPQLASASRLSAASPCRGAGNAAYATGVDIDGGSWANPPSIGCDEYHLEGLTGPLSVAVMATYTNVATGYRVDFTALVEGRATASAWDFGDGRRATNQPYVSHAWDAPGDYRVVLTAYNESHPGGVSAAVTVHVRVEVHYVALESTNPVPPYGSWATAAADIQSAVDAALPGAVVLVSNGVYTLGGRAVYGTMTNRVAVDRPLRVQSVNGPRNTIIQGYQVPGTTNGDGAIRCVYLTDGAALSGFTLTKGATRATGDTDREGGGGGVWCVSASVIVTNCVLTGNAAVSGGGGAYFGTLNNCTLTGNSASYGGGASGGTLNNCTLTGNSASNYGGGVCSGTLNNCTLTDNTVSDGGGACSGTLNNCTLTGNSASDRGGGVYSGTLNNCILTGNSATASGGGADFGDLNNCILTGNSATVYGGGAYYGTLNNCTVTGNSAQVGGGAYDTTLNNCIVWFNTAVDGPNYRSFWLSYCCTTPLPASGSGNISLDPQLASASHLSADSPCRGAGSAGYATGTDIDGEPWLSPPSMGCDEYRLGAITGPLSVRIVTAYTNVAVGFALDLVALIQGRTSASVWEFGDGVVVSNRPYAGHIWTNSGVYTVTLRAYNESQPGGVSATATIHVVAPPVHYVAVSSTNPLPPYASWASAAGNIQDAVDAAVLPGAMVLVGDGTYATGGRAVFGTMTNRAALDKPLSVRSINGPRFTVIQGYQLPGTNTGDGAIRCVYLGSGASLSGFTLSNGATRRDGDLYHERCGGGLWCASATAVVSNCVLAGNSAYQYGGGACGGTLNDCTMTGNQAFYGGGGYSGTLNDCTVAGNQAFYGGGAYAGMLNNCTLSGNSALSDGGGAYGGTLNNCALRNNSAGDGGGAFGSSLDNCTLNNCTLTGNSASWEGGGAYGGTLNNCTLTGNSAAGYGGGAGDSTTLNNCALTSNSASYGGGAGSFATLNNCTLSGNSAESGGGAYSGTLNNCTLTGNLATSGGGAYDAMLNNCTLTSNSATSYGGGAYYGTLNNCIVYFNNAATNGANYYYSSLDHCCTTPVTTPMPTNGVGNITSAPLLVDYPGGNLRLQSNSPCINSGNNAYAPGPTDLDGNPRIVSGTVDIGAYEFQGSGSSSLLN